MIFFFLSQKYRNNEKLLYSEVHILCDPGQHETISHTVEMNYTTDTINHFHDVANYAIILSKT